MSRLLRDAAWRCIQRGLDVSASAKVLLLAIADHVDDRAELRATEATICAWVAMSARSVRRYRAELVTAGVLLKTARSSPGHPPRFTVLPAERITGQCVADEQRPPVGHCSSEHPLQHRPGFDEQRPESALTPANRWPPEPEEPEEPEEAAAELHQAALSIAESRPTTRDPKAVARTILDEDEPREILAAARALRAHRGTRHRLPEQEGHGATVSATRGW